MSISESKAFESLVAARRLYDPGAVVKRDIGPLSDAACVWLRKVGIEGMAATDLDALLRACKALADAETAPNDRSRSPAQAARMQADAWMQIGAIAKRWGYR